MKKIKYSSIIVTFVACFLSVSSVQANSPSKLSQKQLSCLKKPNADDTMKANCMAKTMTDRELKHCLGISSSGACYGDSKGIRRAMTTIFNTRTNKPVH